MSAPRTRIGLREIRAMSPNETIFDGGIGSVPGFGARRRAGPHVSYFIMYRTRDGRQRRYTIGTHGAPWTPDAARAKAQQVLVAARIEGADPQADKKAKRSAATIAELCDMYMEDAEAGRLLTRRGIAKKPSTLMTDRSFIQAHIKPLLGRMKVAWGSQGRWAPVKRSLTRRGPHCCHRATPAASCPYGATFWTRLRHRPAWQKNSRTAVSDGDGAISHLGSRLIHPLREAAGLARGVTLPGAASHTTARSSHTPRAPGRET